MQSNSNRQYYIQQDNNYNSEGLYQSHQESPPPYLPYPQQSGNGISNVASDKSNVGQTVVHQQQGIAVTRVHRRFSNNNLLIPIRIAFSLQLAIVVNLYSSYYNGFWAGIFLIFGGSIMIIIGFRPSFPLFRLVQMYMFTLAFSTFGLAFSIVDYSLSTRCTSISSLYCDDSLAINLKVILLITFSISLIHNSINMIVIAQEQKRILTKSNRRILNN
ncbi:unnamed protein product [Rotaria sp. Silwood2]|nr:unnamed protein product [Rotaria sp. Silwood2]CAF4045222.1 unnamed protein product [Rotaria sp. Silwood2]CAF4147079.1 unnamed protein product [Rotaria sp. Silwood2]